MKIIKTREFADPSAKITLGGKCLACHLEFACDPFDANVYEYNGTRLAVCPATIPKSYFDGTFMPECTSRNLIKLRPCVLTETAAKENEDGTWIAATISVKYLDEQHERHS